MGAGGNRAQEGVLERVQILDNWLRPEPRADEFCCVGITVEAGSDSAEFAMGPPLRYLDDNLVRGSMLASAIALLGGGESGRGNVIRDVAIDGNLIETAALGIGVLGDIGPTAQDNVVDDVRIGPNRIRTAAVPVFIRSNCLGASGNLASATVPATPSPSAATQRPPSPSASSHSGGPTTGATGWAVPVGAVAIIATLTALLLLTVRRRRAAPR